MSIIRLRPSSVVVIGTASKTGTGAVWADDDLATYVSLPNTSGNAFGLFDLAPEVEGALSVTLGMTYTLTSLAGFKSTAINAGSIAGHINPPQVFDGPNPPLATQGDYTYTFTADDYAIEGTSLNAVVARFVSGPQGTDDNVPSINFGNFTGLTVFEAWVDFEMPDTEPPDEGRLPHLRQLGRNDLSQLYTRTQQKGLRAGPGSIL